MLNGGNQPEYQTGVQQQVEKKLMFDVIPRVIKCGDEER